MSTRLTALLRGINVGGHAVTMARLKALFAELGLDEVETFIASGNVLFTTGSRTAPAKLEGTIERHLAEGLGYGVATFLRTPAEIAAVADGPLFAAEAADGGSLYVGFLKQPPAAGVVSAVAGLRTDDDRLEVRGRELYWWCRTGMGTAKLSGSLLERTIGGPATLRNITTVRRLSQRLTAAS